MSVNEESASQEVSVLAAFMFDLFGTLLCQASYLLMKFAHLDNDNGQKSAICSGKYAAGMICLVIGNIIHVVVLPFCPVILLAINSSTAIVITALLAIIFLKEKIVWQYDCVAFLLISGGCTGIVLLSQSMESTMTSEDVHRQLTSIRTIFFFSFYIAFVVCNYMLTRWFEGQLKLFEMQGVQWARQHTDADNYRQYTSRSTATQSTAFTPGQASQERGTPRFHDSTQTNFEDDNYYGLQSPSSPSNRAVENGQVGQEASSEPSNTRPLSHLILAIQNINTERLKEISPGVSKHLKRFIKVPMVSQLSLAGIQAGVAVSSLKWFTETITQGDFGTTEYWIMSVTLVLAIGSAMLQLFFLNSAIARYQQIDFSAVYQVTIMIFTVVCALVLLEEAEAYTAMGLASILSCTALCVLGIYVVTLKTNYKAAKSAHSSSQNAPEDAANQVKLLKDVETDTQTQSLFKLFQDSQASPQEEEAVVV